MLNGTLTGSRRHALDKAVGDGVTGEQRAEAMQVELGADLGTAAVLRLVYRQIADQHGIAHQGVGTDNTWVDRQHGHDRSSQCSSGGPLCRAARPSNRTTSAATW